VNLSDASVVSILLAALSHGHDGAVRSAWDELNRRGWSDDRISASVRAGVS
jgi:hypothetical protein